MTTAVERLVGATDAHRVGSEFRGLCPAHDDHTPSLSIGQGDGCALVTCRTGCETSEVLDALGMQMRDLFDEPRASGDESPDEWLPGDSGRTWVAAYDYVSAENVPVFQVVRFTEPDGSRGFLQRKPDRSKRSGWSWKTADLSPEQREIPYRLPEVLAALDRGEPIWIAEGEKDVEALRKAGATATCNAGGAGKGKWTDRHAAWFKGATTVTVVQDRDDVGRGHGTAVAHSLEGIAISVRLVEAREGKDAHDHLNKGHGLEDFVEVEVEAALGAKPTEVEGVAGAKSADPSGCASSGSYMAKGGGMWQVVLREGPDGEPKITQTRLTNFTAAIVSSTEVDDGSDVERRLDLEATVGGRKRTCSVTGSEFSRMEWVIPELGPSAVLEAGRGVKDHARAAIQSLSDPVEVRVYGQTGWREIDGEQVYLHAGGAIGAIGPMDGIEVDLPGSLAGYVLPKPGGGDAVRASLGVISVAPDRLTIPLLAAVYRAPLGGADMAVGIHGATGIGKSELAALGQQHYGPVLDARALPASWSSTANALEEQAFLTADALLTVDDFCPSGSPRDVDQLHATADRLIRGAGNGAGRGRMSRDGTLRVARPSRGLILTTGEEVPRGQSLRARMMTLEVRRGDVDWKALTAAQQHAAEGTYASAMSAYVAWLAPQIVKLRSGRAAEIADLRGRVTTAHRRTATGIANLAWGWRVWLTFVTEIGAITEAEQADLWARGWTALLEAAEAASAAVGETDPTRRFLALLGSAIASGRAHVATRKGGCPAVDPGAWGWRNRDDVMTDMGSRVGWTEHTNLWLDAEAAYAAARGAGEGLTIDVETLRSRLSEAGLLQSTDPTGKTGVRVRIEGAQRRVLHLRADALEDREEVRHPGVSPVSQGVSDRDTVSHLCDTGVSQAKSVSDKGRCVPLEGETPETPRNNHMMRNGLHFKELEGLEGPQPDRSRSCAPAHAAPRDSGVSAQGVAS